MEIELINLLQKKPHIKENWFIYADYLQIQNHSLGIKLIEHLEHIHPLLGYDLPLFPQALRLPKVFLGLKLLLGKKYLDNYDGTVVDIQSGLVWMRCNIGQAWMKGYCNNKPIKYKWFDIETIIKEVDYAGYQDWILPDMMDLQSIVDKKQSPAIDSDVFWDTQALYWSSSLQINTETLVATINFKTGQFRYTTKGYPCYLRLVRAQPLF